MFLLEVNFEADLKRHAVFAVSCIAMEAWCPTVQRKFAVVAFICHHVLLPSKLLVTISAFSIDDKKGYKEKKEK